MDNNKPLFRMYCDGVGTHMELLGEYLGPAVKNVEFRHNAKDKGKPELSLTLDLSCLKAHDKGRFDEAYKRYTDFLNTEYAEGADGSSGAETKTTLNTTSAQDEGLLIPRHR